MEDELKIVLKSEDALRLDMQDQQPLELLLNNPVTYTGTTNYNELGNKPSINSVTLQGNKTAQELNLVHRAGDSMTGVLVVPNIVSKYGIEFQNAGGTNVGAVCQDMSNNNNQVYVDEYTAEGKRECYLFPAPTANEPTFHDILTSKNAVTIAQGGTGASTAADACENIGAVNKTGDTMTGNLKMTNGAKVGVTVSTINIASTPSSAVNQDVVWGEDANGNNICFMRAKQASDGTTGVELNARRTIGNATYFNGVTFNISPTGERSIGVSDAEIWRTTLGAVNIAGDTMTGTLNTPTTRIYDASAPMLTFISSATDTSALAAVYSQISNRNLVLRTRGTSGYVEDYMLPNNTTTNAHVNYEIFNSKEGVLAYKDQTVSISLSANTWTEMTVTQQVAPTGYTPLTRTIADGSTTAIRGYLFLAPNNMGNTAHILLYSTQAVTGTFTLRTWFVKSSAAVAL